MEASNSPWVPRPVSGSKALVRFIGLLVLALAPRRRDGAGSGRGPRVGFGVAATVTRAGSNGPAGQLPRPVEAGEQQAPGSADDQLQPHADEQQGTDEAPDGGPGKHPLQDL